MRKISADYIFPVSSPPIKNGVVKINDDGVVVAIGDSRLKAQDSRLEIYEGIICPGFINTHCHLELSHLKSKIDPGKGLDEFIKKIQVYRNSDQRKIIGAIEQAENEMLANGIIAVGDISNKKDSFQQKKKKKLKYHTFIEAFAFHPDKADVVFDKAKSLLDEYITEVDSNKNHVSITPHAPYSASERLLKKIADYAHRNNSLLTIHNQENADENEFFIKKQGNLLERFRQFGIDISFWEPTGLDALQSTLIHLPKYNKIGLVHNTFTSKEDIEWAHKYYGNKLQVTSHKSQILNLKSQMIYWCTCPNANLYIENKLPDYSIFIARQAKMTIGTDSYASNWSLSILDELKTISRYFPKISLETLLVWATKNGAEFLGFDTELGTIEKGKKPGLNLIKNVSLEEMKLTERSEVKVLA